jgi:hypothetical protein
VAWSLVQKSASVATSSTGASVAPTLPASSTGGNLLVAHLGTESDPDTISGPAGWLQASEGLDSSGGSGAIWYYKNNPGGIASATFTDSASQIFAGVLTEFTAPGVSGATLDQHGTGSASSGSSCAVTGSGASAAGDLAVAAWNQDRPSATLTPPSGWTSAGAGGSPNIALLAAYELSASAGTLSATATSTSSGAWACALATFSTTTPAAGSASLAGSGSVTAGATEAVPGGASLTGAGSVTAGAVLTIPAAASLAGAGAVAAAAVLKIPAAASLAGAGTLTASPGAPAQAPSAFFAFF